MIEAKKKSNVWTWIVGAAIGLVLAYLFNGGKKSDAPAPTPVVAETPAPVAAAPEAAPETPAPTAAPAGNVTDPGLISKDFVNDMLQLAAAGSWSTISERLRVIRVLTPPAGDRKLAREHNRVGLEYFARNDYDRAVAEFQKGIEASPADVELRNNLGYAELRAGRPEKATDALLQALLIDPTRAAAWANAAEAFADRGREAGAESAIKLTVYFSRNQARTITILASGEPGTSARFRDVVSRVMPELAAIPQYSR